MQQSIHVSNTRSQSDSLIRSLTHLVCSTIYTRLIFGSSFFSTIRFSPCALRDRCTLIWSTSIIWLGYSIYTTLFFLSHHIVCGCECLGIRGGVARISIYVLYSMSQCHEIKRSDISLFISPLFLRSNSIIQLNSLCLFFYFQWWQVIFEAFSYDGNFSIKWQMTIWYQIQKKIPYFMQNSIVCA